MSKFLTYIQLLLIVNFSFSQNDFFSDSDTLSPKRVGLVSGTVGSAWIGSMIGLSQVWYKNIPKTKWHTFDDSKNWLQMDKFGHFYTAYKINNLVTNSFEWSGLPKNSSIILGTTVSFGYQTTFEIFDAYSQEWGFSWSDMAANTIGSGGYLVQKLVWDEERIIPKFSFRPTEFAKYRPEILGKTFSEQLLKDYNGQTYWLSASPGTFLKDSNFPKWLCFSVGYSSHEKLVGSEEYYIDQNTGKEFFSKREILFSLDIDFTRIPVKKPWVKAILSQLNYLKIPFPTVGIRSNSLYGDFLGY